MNNFLEMNISDQIIEALKENSILEPTPIQGESIPLLLEGKDVIGQAQTGTGKTFAYAIPLIQRIDINNKNIQALVMCPTRELSLQVSKEIAKLCKKSKIKAATIYGGESYDKQFRELAKKPSIIIGTPGRIIDHLNRGTISFANVTYLVLDEADEMLKMGFQDDMETILSKMPTERQTALFSATLPPFIKNISKKYMIEPTIVKIENKTLTVDRITQYLYYVKKEQKKDLLVRLLDYYQFKSVMIFANTKAMVDELVLYLQENHLKADGLHGDLKQANRDRVMASFRNQAIEILIATDVAARGIDVDGIEAIINFDIPQENEIYVHRIGRTGRAGKTGMAITFATTRQARSISDLERFTKCNMQKGVIPQTKDIIAKNNADLLDILLEKIEESKDNHAYDDILVKLAKKITDPAPIIVALLDMVSKKSNREYANIDVVSPRSSSDSRSRSTSSKGGYQDRSSRTTSRSTGYSERSARGNGEKKERDSSRRGSSSSSPIKFSYVCLNVGADMNVRPNQLVNYLHDELRVHREHFGKIVIDDNKTYMEVNENALKYFKDLDKKSLNGKKLNYSLVKSMPAKK